MLCMCLCVCWSIHNIGSLHGVYGVTAQGTKIAPVSSATKGTYALIRTVLSLPICCLCLSPHPSLCCLCPASALPVCPLCLPCLCLCPHLFAVSILFSLPRCHFHVRFVMHLAGTTQACAPLSMWMGPSTILLPWTTTGRSRLVSNPFL